MSILQALLLAGLMGMIGQGARAAIGLKKAAEEAKDKGLSQADVFSAARLLVSLMLGFIAGVIAGLTLGLEEIMKMCPTCAAGGTPAVNLKLLLGIAAAGYAGTDFIEGAFSKLVATPADAVPPATPKMAVATALLSRVDVLETKVDRLGAAPPSGGAADIRAAAAADDAPVLTGAAAHEGDITGEVTPAMVKQMFPATPLANVKRHLPNVLSGLREFQLGDKPMVLMALATIRAETEGFVPISEFQSSANTANTPFDKYEPGTPAGNRIGNTQPGDGPRFRGRGFVQLTGRENYTRVGAQLGLNLVGDPALANDSVLAGKILARFLKNAEEAIRNALAADDLRTARRLVNGGQHGFGRFESAHRIGENVLPAA